MTRTQIYLPEDLHNDLRTEAKLSGLSISELIRIGSAKEITKRKAKRSAKKINGLAYFANPPKSHLIKLSMSAADIVRQERD